MDDTQLLIRQFQSGVKRMRRDLLLNRLAYTHRTTPAEIERLLKEWEIPNAGGAASPVSTVASPPALLLPPPPPPPPMETSAPDKIGAPTPPKTAARSDVWREMSQKVDGALTLLEQVLAVQNAILTALPNLAELKAVPGKIETLGRQLHALQIEMAEVKANAGGPKPRKAAHEIGPAVVAAKRAALE